MFVPRGRSLDRSALEGFGSVMSVNEMPAVESPGFEPEGNPEQEQQATALIQGYAGLILNPIITSKPQSERLQQERAELVSALAEISARAGQFLAQVQSERLTDLEKRLEAARDQGREQIEIVARSESEFARSEQRLLNAFNGQRAASLVLREHKDRPPDKFAPRGERTAYVRKERELIQACREVDKEHAEALAARNRMAEECNRENGELARISAEIDRLEAAAQGKKINDPTTGLEGIPQY